MTPEELAKQAMFGSNAPFMDDDMLTASHGYIINYPMLVAAIRDAVKAEKEACAFVAEFKRLVNPKSYRARGYNDACDDIATAIRERTP